MTVRPDSAPDPLRSEEPPPADPPGGPPPAPADQPRHQASGRSILLICVAAVALVGLLAWLTSGGSPAPAGTGGVGALPAQSTAGPQPIYPTPVVSSAGRQGKSGSTPGGTPYTEFTPAAGAEPAIEPASSLPGVSGPDPTVPCPTATVSVSDSAGLAQALGSARPGTVIQLADGTYAGQFTATAPGTAAQPIFLCGDSGAVLDGTATGSSGGYVLHLVGADYWRLSGFTVQDGQKGVVLDHSNYTILEHLTVQNTGDEGIHLREFSNDDLVLDNIVRQTGSARAKYGEGVYIGTAKSNWCTYTDCKEDFSDNDVIRGNDISDTTAENVDIKEGTTGGALIDNTFDGAGFSKAGASGWVNAKGNNYLIMGNVGHNSYQDGFQTHQILAGWGQNNVFVDNTAVVNGSGYGFHFTPVNGNVWACNNKVQGAARGESNIPCSNATPAD